MLILLLLIQFFAAHVFLSFILVLFFALFLLRFFSLSVMSDELLQHMFYDTILNTATSGIVVSLIIIIILLLL
jgi:hypothetical protein